MKEETLTMQKDFWTIRSRAQGKASGFTKKGNLSEARSFDKFADALLRDLTGQKMVCRRL